MSSKKSRLKNKIYKYILFSLSNLTHFESWTNQILAISSYNIMQKEELLFRNNVIFHFQFRHASLTTRCFQIQWRINPGRKRNIRQSLTVKKAGAKQRNNRETGEKGGRVDPGDKHGRNRFRTATYPPDVGLTVEFISNL